MKDSTRIPDDPGVAARLRAARILDRHRRTGENADSLIPSAPGHGAVLHLVHGVIKRRRTIDRLLKNGVAFLPEDSTGELLRIGIFQLVFETTVPDYAVVASVTEAIRADGNSGKTVGFVNAVLRNFIRRRERLLATLARAPLPVRESHPDLLVHRWQQNFGREATLALCRWNNRPPTTTLFPLPAAGGREAFLERCRQSGFELAPHPASRSGDALVMPRGAAVTELPGYREGAFIVQDPAALLAATLLDPAPGQRVLDGCAAPGGKAVRAGLAIGPGGELLAVEIHPDRVRRLEETLARCGVDDRARVLCADFLELTPERTGGRFDRILLDAPCTNTGVLQRRPEARWRFSRPRLAERVRLQTRLLDHAPALLAPRGKIVYATCSLEPEENREIVAKFLECHPEFHTVAEASSLPFRDGMDGMYAAALARR